MQDAPYRRESRTSRYRGVSWHERAHKWQVYAMVDGVNRYLGLFRDEKEAAAVARSVRRHQRLARPAGQRPMKRSRRPSMTNAVYMKVAIRDQVCQDCGGWDDSPRGMQVHHLDGKGWNHELDNLILLCAGCHRKRHRR